MSEGRRPSTRIKSVAVFYPDDTQYFRPGLESVKHIHAPGGWTNHGNAVVIEYDNGSESHIVGMPYELTVKA